MTGQVGVDRVSLPGVTRQSLGPNPTITALQAVFFSPSNFSEVSDAKKQQIVDVILLKHLMGMIRFSS